MEPRRFGREFTLKAVKLVRERCVVAAQAARDLDVHQSVPRKCDIPNAVLATVHAPRRVLRGCDQR